MKKFSFTISQLQRTVNDARSAIEIIIGAGVTMDAMTWHKFSEIPFVAEIIADHKEEMS